MGKVLWDFFKRAPVSVSEDPPTRAAPTPPKFDLLPPQAFVRGCFEYGQSIAVTRGDMLPDRVRLTMAQNERIETLKTTLYRQAFDANRSPDDKRLQKQLDDYEAERLRAQQNELRGAAHVRQLAESMPPRVEPPTQSVLLAGFGIVTMGFSFASSIVLLFGDIEDPSRAWALAFVIGVAAAGLATTGILFTGNAEKGRS
jgi:hypothetical protein